jgi:hypothetical protein
MDTAHYKCMTQSDWLAVKQERLMLDMPLKIGWENLDNRLVSRFFERHPERRGYLYECALSAARLSTYWHHLLQLL